MKEYKIGNETVLTSDSIDLQSLPEDNILSVDVTGYIEIKSKSISIPVGVKEICISAMKYSIPQKWDIKKASIKVPLSQISQIFEIEHSFNLVVDLGGYMISSCFELHGHNRGNDVYLSISLAEISSTHATISLSRCS